MSREELEHLFKKHHDKFLNFHDVVNPRSRRPDLNAFLLLDSLLPNGRDIIGGADHDVVYLSINPARLAEVVSEDQVIELIRCGVRLEPNGLEMFA